MMISKEVGELVQEKMKDIPKTWEDLEKENPSLDGLIKRDIDLTKPPK